MSNTSTKYSDEDLQEFKEIIEHCFVKQKQLQDF